MSDHIYTQDEIFAAVRLSVLDKGTMQSEKF